MGQSKHPVALCPPLEPRFTVEAPRVKMRVPTAAMPIRRMMMGIAAPRRVRQKARIALRLTLLCL